ncbi:MAG: hypothetical protein J1F04_01730 [Oscillospiraceae bacterium]|nr:hypothetical protein [Oscillospiraceae bacterium]
MKKREIIAGVLLFLGMLLAVGSVGTLDFLGDSATEDEVNREIAKSIIASAMIVSSPIVTGISEESEKDGDDNG